MDAEISPEGAKDFSQGRHDAAPGRISKYACADTMSAQ
jgi:hypothetical protein